MKLDPVSSAPRQAGAFGRGVRRARPEFLAVAAALRAEGRVAPSAVAQVSRPLTDSTSSLYRTRSTGSLRQQVGDIADQLGYLSR